MTLRYDGVSGPERESVAALRAWPPQPRRRFRRHLATRREQRRRRVVVAVVVFVVLVIGAVVYCARYQPLIPSQFAYSANRVVTSTGRLASSFPTSGPSSLTEWREPTGNFSVDFVVTISNGGPYPVRVSRVTSWSPTTTPTTAYMDTFNKHGFAGGRPLTPFIVVGHGTQTVAVHVAEHCVASSTNRVETITRLPVTFSFLHFTHTTGVTVSPLWLRLRTSCA